MELNYDMACRIIGDLYIQAVIKERNPQPELLDEIARLKAEVVDLRAQLNLKNVMKTTSPELGH